MAVLGSDAHVNPRTGSVERSIPTPRDGFMCAVQGSVHPGALCGHVSAGDGRRCLAPCGVQCEHQVDE